MGITGLIPFLEKASKRGNISQFSGGTVAIDSYCWLHKGAFSCADKIAMGQPTDAHVKYCMKFVHMLLANRIKPILVFDGRHLPAKKETEVKRKENRESIRRRAAELMRMGQTAEGRNLLRRSIDITHEMALQLIQKCQEENVDCIVAPYEADAQLAYLNIIGIADVIITEDSDLTLFGCKKIFFKMDVNGNGLLVEQNLLHRAMNVQPEKFDIDKFRYMCILSGCDYLASLPGIGLNKALKFVMKNTEDDIHKALCRLGSYLNMKGLIVTKEYRDAFISALITFKHQLVYCPLQRKQVRLFPPSPEVSEEQLHFAGDVISEDLAYQLALGNYDPFTMKKLHDFDPDCAQKQSKRTNSWHEKPSNTYASIWSKSFQVSEEKENKKSKEITQWPDTAGKITTLNTASIKRKMTPKKRNFEELAEEISENEALALYGSNKLQKNEPVVNGGVTSPLPANSPHSSDDETIKSPILSTRTNPFAKTTNDSQVSPSVVCRGKRRIKLKSLVGFRPTVIDNSTTETSKYFNTKSAIRDSKETEANDNTKCDRFVTDSWNNETNKIIVEVDESMDNRESNFIEETVSQKEESSNSSGVFSNDQISQGKVTSRLDDINENEPIAAMQCISENENGENETFTESNLLLEAGYNIEDYKLRLSTVSTEKNIESFRSHLYQWANTKNTVKTSIKSTPSKNRPVVTAKTRVTKKITSQMKTVPIDGQQSLLNMFGFQKKPILKRSVVTSIEENDIEN